MNGIVIIMTKNRIKAGVLAIESDNDDKEPYQSRITGFTRTTCERHNV